MQEKDESIQLVYKKYSLCFVLAKGIKELLIRIFKITVKYFFYYNIITKINVK